MKEGCRNSVASVEAFRRESGMELVGGEGGMVGRGG